MIHEGQSGANLKNNKNRKIKIKIQCGMPYKPTPFGITPLPHLWNNIISANQSKQRLNCLNLNQWSCVLYSFYLTVFFYPFHSLLDEIINTEQKQDGAEQQEFLRLLETVILTILLSIIILITVFGNLLVMVALCKDRHLRWACNPPVLFVLVSV